MHHSSICVSILDRFLLSPRRDVQEKKSYLVSASRTCCHTCIVVDKQKKISRTYEIYLVGTRSYLVPTRYIFISSHSLCISVYNCFLACPFAGSVLFRRSKTLVSAKDKMIQCTDYHYTLVAKNMDWGSAARYCQWNGKGHLVMIRSATEHRALAAYLWSKRGQQLRHVSQ